MPAKPRYNLTCAFLASEIAEATSKDFVRLVQQRKDRNQDLDPADIYALCDCGKDGNKSRLLGVFCLAPEPDEAGKMQKPAQCKKKVRTWTATMLESSITERPYLGLFLKGCKSLI